MTNTQIADRHAVEALDVLGPTLQILTPLDEGELAPCMIRGTIPPGGIVPLHAHDDPESFLLLSGAAEILIDAPDARTWARVARDDVVHVPGGKRHAFRNTGSAPAVMILVTTARLGRFFREVAGGDAQRFAATAARYGHWLGTPEENAAVGLTLPPAG